MILKEQGILAKHGNNNNNGQSNNTKDKGKNSYWNRNKVVNNGVVYSSKSNDQGVLHFVSANLQGNKPRYQDRPKGERQDFATFGESYDEILTNLIA